MSACAALTVFGLDIIQIIYNAIAQRYIAGLAGASTGTSSTTNLLNHAPAGTALNERTVMRK